MKNKGIRRGETVFGEHARSPIIVPTRSQQNALRFLSSGLARPHFTAVVQGPAGSGKSTTAHQCLENAGDTPAALIDGAHLNARELLLALVSAFEIDEGSDHEERLLRALSEWLHIRRETTPLLMIDDIDRASTSALRLVDWLSAIEVDDQPALRIALFGREPLVDLLRNDSLKHFARRKSAVYSLNPLTPSETRYYLRAQVTAAGEQGAERLFPAPLCASLHLESRGWPGALNRLAREVLDRSDLSQAESAPRVILTCDGETLADIELTDRLYVIGRSELADIVVNDRFASKMHAMLQRYRNALVLFDLNSTNGTTVNANEVRKTLLRTNDVISLGRHRLKILDAPVIDAAVEDQIRHSDTMTVRHLADLRRKRARRNIVALKNA